jgi:hypothetical protein
MTNEPVVTAAVLASSLQHKATRLPSNSSFSASDEPMPPFAPIIRYAGFSSEACGEEENVRAPKTPLAAACERPDAMASALRHPTHEIPARVIADFSLRNLDLVRFIRAPQTDTKKKTLDLEHGSPQMD